MANKQKSRSISKTLRKGVLPADLIDEMAAINDETITYILTTADELVASQRKRLEGKKTKLAISASSFLEIADPLISTIKYGNRDAAVEAAVFFGISAGRLFAEMDVGFRRCLGGHNSAIFQGDEALQNLKEDLNECCVGERPNYKLVAKAALARGVKGRECRTKKITQKLRPPSKRTIARHAKTFE